MSRRRASALCAGLAVGSLAAPVAAQGVDIVEQNVHFDLTGVDTVITVDATLEAKASASTLDFYAAAMPVVAAEVDGVAATIVDHPAYPELVQRLTYPAPLAAGDLAHVHLVLSGTPSCEAFGAPGKVVCLRSDEETIFTPSSPGSAWYLMNLYDIDPFVGAVTVKAPESHLVVAGQGAPTAVETSPGFKTWTYAFEQPTEALGLYAAIADEASSEDGAAVAYFGKESTAEPAKVALAAEIASDLLPIYGELYGELPFGPAHLLSVPPVFAFAGLGLLGNVFMGEYIFGDYDYLLEQGVAHELGHSWWAGLASAGIQEEGGFLQEAFAEYSAWRALGQLRGDAVRTAGVRMNAVWYMYRRPGDDDIAVLSPSVFDSPLYVFVTYHKGSVFLRTLEQTIGEDAFTEALRAFVARGYGGLSVDALVEDIATTSGYDASALVDQWLHETGFPRLGVSSETRPGADGGVEVALRIEAQGAFDLRLPVHLIFGDGTSTEHEIELHAGPNEQLLTADLRPVAIEIDPRWTLSREVLPTLPGDVTLDGTVDAADLIEVALRDGAELPEERRVDGSYDPLFDVDGDRRIDGADLDAARAAASSAP